MLMYMCKGSFTKMIGLSRIGILYHSVPFPRKSFLID